MARFWRIRVPEFTDPVHGVTGPRLGKQVAHSSCILFSFEACIPLSEFHFFLTLFDLELLPSDSVPPLPGHKTV